MTAGLRTHHCGDPRATHVGQTVTLMGWVDRRRDHGGVIFVDLRDHTGVVQVVFKPEVGAGAHKLGDTLRHEYVIAVSGKMAPREEGNINPKLSTGEVELLAEHLEVLNTAKPLPFVAEDEVDERLRLKYRYLDLRSSTMQRNLRLRALAARVVRSHLDAAGFCEVETPVLTRSTPEGARDYLVPSRVNLGQFYALPQSPQLFKQILMIGGFNRYYQIVKCFRDEDLRGNRQPEFTQVDIELAFTQPEEIFALIDALFARLFRETIGFEVPLPIPRITYQEAMDRFGSDAPDMRFGLELVQLTDIVAKSGFKVFAQAVGSGGQVRGIRVPGGAELSRKELDELTEFVAIYGAKGMAWVKVQEGGGWQSPIAKFLSPQEQQGIRERMGLQVGDLAVFCADSEKVVLDALGNLRKEVARRQNLFRDDDFKFVWVTDFPLFEYDEQEKRLAAKHHPFTSPVVEDLEQYAASEPLKIRARAYDIALNGVELGGGSIRMHKPELQQQVFKLLGMSEEEAERRFGFLLEALSYGAPPHGGIALGFDRIIMYLVNTASIRDVIAFPKTQKATDLMVQAPSEVDDKQLRELGIRLRT